MTHVIFARVQPEEVRINETYRHEQTLGRTVLVPTAQAPTGQISVAVSYDGYQSFTRQAQADVRHQWWRLQPRPLATTAPSRLRRVISPLSQRVTATHHRVIHLVRRRQPGTPAAVSVPTPPADALMGHLLLDNYGRTNLGAGFDLENSFGALPLRVPIHGDGLDNLHQLLDDRCAAKLTFDYVPQTLAVRPLQMTVEMSDSTTPAWPPATASQQDVLTFLSQTAQTAEASDLVRFSFQVELHLPRTSLPAGQIVTIKQMWLEWPQPLSVPHQVARLMLGGKTAEAEAPAPVPDLVYNPSKRHLAWGGVVLSVHPTPARPDLITLVSPPMHLISQRPADLYQVDSLDGEVEIELPGLLLSGLQTFYYDGIGRRLDQVKQEKISCLLLHFKLILADLFAQRQVLLYRQAHVPNAGLRGLRLPELETHLADSSFRITRVVANRVAGNDWQTVFGVEPRARPQSLQAWVVLGGRRSTATRGNSLYSLTTVTHSELDIQLHCLSSAEHLETALTLNRLQTALIAHFEQMGAEQ
ncbi:MAG: hypothetical protein WAW26_05390 [Anaerolineae bacterium]